MRKLMWIVIVVAVVTGLVPCGFASSDPDQPSRDIKSMTVAELEKAGDACRAQKDYEQAQVYFREALRQDKKNAKLYNKLGLAELKASNLDSARLDFEKASKMNKKYSDAFNNLGAVYFMQKNFGQATKYFKKAVALEETRPAFHVNLGAARRRWIGPSMNTAGRWNWIPWRWRRTPGSASPRRFQVLKSERSTTTCWQKFRPSAAICRSAWHA